LINEDTEVGGYLCLEHNETDKNNYWGKSLLMNSAKNCFNILIKKIEAKKIFLPRYTCEVMHQLQYENESIQYYNIDNFYLVEKHIKLDKNDVLIYTNYFGVNDVSCQKTIDRFGKDKVIVDNAQSLLSEFDCLANVYSPRKFLGIPDGGIIKSNYIDLDIELPVERTSAWGFMHLLLRRDRKTKLGYAWHKKNERRIINLKPKLMSTITSSLLEQINIENIIKKRLNNFNFLNEKLKSINKLDVSNKSVSPLCYPLLTEETLRNYLHANNIFTPHYWKSNSNLNSFENKLSNMSSFLPIDQNLSEKKLLYIIDVIEKYE
jgi:hypothetical protein